MNKRVEKQKAKETLPKLLNMVNKGLGPIEIVDQKKDKTLAYIISTEDYENKRRRKSYRGFLKGRLIVSPDFDEPQQIKNVNL